MTYDCFTFFNELDLLEIRLHILDKVVDKFVLVEATRTHQNKPKELHYQNNKKRFDSFSHKIIHIVVDNYPSFISKLRRPTSWDLEKHQRNQIRKGLTNCKPNDIILVSDLDEIPDPEKITANKDFDGVFVFKQMNFYYYLNCISETDTEEPWFGTVMTQAKNFRQPQELRAVSNKMHAENARILNDKFYRLTKSITHPVFRKEISLIDKGGWHFSFLGGVDKIVEKLEAFAHTEYNKAEFKDKKSILELIKNGKNLFGRDTQYKFIPVDETLPDYIRECYRQYQNLFYNLPG